MALPICLWKLQLFHSAEFIWVLDDRGIYRLESKTGLTLPLIDGLVAELRLDYDHSSAPSTRLENSDTEAVLALGYRW